MHLSVVFFLHLFVANAILLLVHDKKKTIDECHSARYVSLYVVRGQVVWY